MRRPRPSKSQRDSFGSASLPGGAGDRSFSCNVTRRPTCGRAYAHARPSGRRSSYLRRRSSNLTTLERSGTKSVRAPGRTTADPCLRRRDVMAEPLERAQPAIDWEAIERSPEFQELVHRRRRFVIPCTIFFLSWYLGFILLTAYASDFMGERVYEGLTVGYCLALTQFVMVLVLGLWYLRKADSDFDPLAERAIDAYADDDLHPGGQRFRRDPATTPAAELRR